MRSSILGSIAAAAATALTAGAAHAADATPTGVELGLRTGYSLPLGKIAGAANGGSGPDLSDSLNGMVPIWLDAGYRFNPNMMVGAYFQYGIGFVNTGKVTECSMGGVSCNVNDIMFGAQFHYHLMPDQTIDPWGGIGIGYEILNASQSAGGQSASSNFNGWQFVNFQVGADYKAMPNLGIGPFIMFSVGEYSNCGLSVPNVNVTSCSIPNTAIHEWLTFGIRGAYDINVGG